MPIWPVASTVEEPTVLLSEWQIYEVDGGARHFVGYNLHSREGRVSSAIVSFDPTTRIGVTSSGRVYELRGEPGSDPDAECTWTGWKHFNAVKQCRLVTDEPLAGSWSSGYNLSLK